jgi:hypothetical protein
MEFLQSYKQATPKSITDRTDVFAGCFGGRASSSVTIEKVEAARLSRVPLTLQSSAARFVP